MRIRTVKPEFWLHEELAKLGDFPRLVALGLLNYADEAIMRRFRDATVAIDTENTSVAASGSSHSSDASNEFRPWEAAK